MQKKIIHTVIAGGLGSLLEMYDFTIYILIAPILTTLFFPHQNYLVSLMLTLSVFAVGFVVRPFGSLIFGYFGDKLGRKIALMTAMIMMGGTAILIALIPTYEMIGIAAPCLLIFLRILQGFSVGGEFSGALTFIAEHANPKYRGFATSWNVFFIDLGAMLASGSYSLLIKHTTSAQLISWGWRLLFLFGGTVALLGIFLRSKLVESPLFLKNEKEKHLLKNPILSTITTHRRDLLKGIGMNVCVSVFAGMILLFMPTYITMVTKITLDTALYINTISLLILCCGIPFFGWLSDILGRKTISLFGCLGLIIFSYPLFLLIQTGSVSWVMSSMIVLDIFGSALFGTFGAMLTEIATTPSRYSLVAFAYNISFAFLAGTAPILTLYFIHIAGNPAAPGLYLALSALVSFSVILTLKSSEKTNLI